MMEKQESVLAKQEPTTVIRGRSKAKWRLAAVGGAVLAAMLVWVVATQAFSVDLRSPAFSESQPSEEIGIGQVIFASLIVGLAGWALLAVLERLTATRARLIWTIVAAVVLVLSFVTPLSGSDTTGTSRLTLMLLHLAVGSVLIVGLPRAVGVQR